MNRIFSMLITTIIFWSHDQIILSETTTMYILMITKLGTLNAPIWLGVIHRSIIHPLEFNLKINGILRYIHPVPSVHTAIRARQESGCSWRLLMTSLLFETSQYWHACSRSILLYYNTTTDVWATCLRIFQQKFFVSFSLYPPRPWK